jgi:hypothetical protein
MVAIIIVEKNGSVKETNVKSISEDELYKKCGYKKPDGFEVRAKWKVSIKKDVNQTFRIEMYAKEEGRANSENKYDFPPPVDTKLFFGNCLLINKDDDGDIDDLSKEHWEMVYEKLFGGFEDLTTNAEEDENEEDELENIPSEMKTKDGYLKDDFVIEMSDEDEDEISISSNEDAGGDGPDDDDEDDDEDDDTENVDGGEDDEVGSEDEPYDDLGSEISEEEYIYSDEEA